MRALYEFRVHRDGKTLVRSYIHNGWCDFRSGTDHVNIPIGPELVRLALRDGPYASMVEVNGWLAFRFTRVGADLGSAYADFERVAFLLDGAEYVVEYRIQSVER